MVSQSGVQIDSGRSPEVKEFGAIGPWRPLALSVAVQGILSESQASNGGLIGDYEMPDRVVDSPPVGGRRTGPAVGRCLGQQLVEDSLFIDQVSEKLDVHVSRRYRVAISSDLTQSSPLEGIRVLDLSRVVAGPLCGRILADLGADVVKVEPPGGDVTRSVGPQVGGVSAYFAQMNAGKRNLCIDLKAPGATDLIARLADHCDVVIENFRPGVLDRAGLGSEVLRLRNPMLIYCSITGWGQHGPWRDRQAYAPLIHAEAGMLEFAGRVRGRPVEQEVQIHGDTYPALMAANAVTTALFQRSRTGKGQHLDVSMGEALVYMNEWAAVELQRHEGPWGPFDIWEQLVLPLRDGTSVAMVGNPERLFGPWMTALGNEAIAADPRFDTVEAIADHREEAVFALALAVSQVADFATLEAMVASMPMLVAEVRSIASLAETEWAEFRPLVVEVAPAIKVPRAPWRSDGATIGATGPVAGQGAHNREVLVEWAGLDADEIAELEATSAILRL
jgi:crotonobetainyl-CoA:carnitine CoA-transferase CaiB-like acyl-CoA transferase